MQYDNPQPVTPARQMAWAAARWWAQFLERPANFDNGDQSGSYAFGAAMAADGRSRLAFTSEQVDQFTARLASYIEGMIRKSEADGNWRPDEPRWGGYIRAIQCDYGAGWPLAEAYRDTFGKNPGSIVFPWKTVMHVNPDQVTVNHVYSQHEDTIVYTEAERAENQT